MLAWDTLIGMQQVVKNCLDSAKICDYKHDSETSLVTRDDISMFMHHEKWLFKDLLCKMSGKERMFNINQTWHLVFQSDQNVGCKTDATVVLLDLFAYAIFPVWDHP